MAAWSLSWESARQTSGDGWQTGFLSPLLDDPYSMVRFKSAESLVKLGAKLEAYDYMKSPEDREPSVAAPHEWSEDSKSREGLKAFFDAQGNFIQSLLDSFAQAARRPTHHALRIARKRLVKDKAGNVVAEGPRANEPAVDRLRKRHLMVGWWSLLLFLALGIVLESLHGFKIQWYLAVDNETAALDVDLGSYSRYAAGVGTILPMPHRLAEERDRPGALALPAGGLRYCLSVQVFSCPWASCWAERCTIPATQDSASCSYHQVRPMLLVAVLLISIDVSKR